MRVSRFLVLGLILAIAGCSAQQRQSLGDFFTSPPTTKTQADLIAAARIGARPACMKLAEGLKPDQLAQVRASLDFVGSLVKRDDAGAQKAVLELMTANVPAAPYAPLVAAAVQIGVDAAQVPDDVRASTYGSIALAVIAECSTVLGNGGAA